MFLRDAVGIGQLINSTLYYLRLVRFVKKIAAYLFQPHIHYPAIY
jgi:hypothetical protein